MQYTPTPVIELREPALESTGVRLLVKREDLNHATISGNKWWKLKYNLEKAKDEGHDALLTFGGAFSNHIYATAAAARENGMRSIGIIRGEKQLPLNATLSFAESQGMELHYISREAYRLKNDPEFRAKLRERFGDFFLIPEGGTNIQALQGCEAFARQELAQVDFDHVVLPVGTGGTMAGVICGVEGRKQVTGISVLKNGEFLDGEIRKMINEYRKTSYGNWRVLTSYHHGGYAKVTKELLGFVSAMQKQHNLPLDNVYTGKMLFAVMKEISLGTFPVGATILVIHTGGLQGSGR